ncbi:MAG: ATP-dependent Clp protease proteolytic subunit, partial [Duncaniella sp.]|nr:ATP-dependent Clp protease proteolytic subunit [Duncaniella sp.]
MTLRNFLRTLIFLLTIVGGTLNLRAEKPKDIYMLRLDDEIGSKTWRYTQQALDEARERGSEMVIVHLNTYGGSVVHADSIRTALLNFQRPVVAFVDNNAASAGALIALACDSVYMRGSATMGAVTVVNGTDGQAMPDKYQSYMRAMMRATAESHGKVTDSLGYSHWRRDPLIAEAMVDSRVEVPGLIDSTRVLTFTADEAVKWH